MRLVYATIVFFLMYVCALAIPVHHDLSSILARANLLATSFRGYKDSGRQPTPVSFHKIVQTNLCGEVSYIINGKKFSVEERDGPVRKSYYYYLNLALFMYHEVDESNRRCRVYLFHPNGRLKQEMYTEGERFIDNIREYSEEGILVGEKPLRGKRVPSLTMPPKACNSSLAKQEKKREVTSVGRKVDHLAEANLVATRARELLQEVNVVNANRKHSASTENPKWSIFTNAVGNAVESRVLPNGLTCVVEHEGCGVVSYTYRYGRLESFSKMSTNTWTGVAYSFYETGCLKSSASIVNKRYKGASLQYDETGKVKGSCYLEGVPFVVSGK